MLITISGMVGSGKSTTAKRVVQRLEACGLKPRYHRFRSFGLWGLATVTTQSSVATGAATAPGNTSRGCGFRLRRLTIFRALGYAGRVLAFRLSAIGSAGRCDVLDRYFYDNLIHYELSSTLERVYVRMLRQLIPEPDVALLLVASDKTISRRRPNYAPEYVALAARRYEALAHIFPNLIFVRTDPESSSRDEISQILHVIIKTAYPSSCDAT
jgi:thymidylate kinase